MHIEANLHHEGAVIGRLRAVKILLSNASDEEQSWFEICDYRRETCDVHHAMCADDGYREFVEALSGQDLLYLETAEILREFRGKQLGTAMVLETISLFASGCAAIVLEAHPIRHRAEGSPSPWERGMRWDKLAKTDQQYKRGAERLRAYWGKLGFIEVPGSDRFMYRDCAFTYKLDEEPIRASLNTLEGVEE